MQIHAFKAGCLNQETVKPQETLDSCTNFQLFQFRVTIDDLQGFIQQRPHPSLFFRGSFILIQVSVKFLNIVNIQEIILIHLSFHRSNIRRSDRLVQNCLGIEWGKGRLNILIFIFEIQHKGFLIIGRTNSVQARKGLHSIDSSQSLVHIHGAELWLVKASLILIRHQQHLIAVAVKHFRQIFFLNAVHHRFGVFVAVQRNLARKRHQCTNTRIPMLGNIGFKLVPVFDCCLP